MTSLIGEENLIAQHICSYPSKLPHVLECKTSNANSQINVMPCKSVSLVTHNRMKEQSPQKASNPFKLIPLHPPLKFQDEPKIKSAKALIENFASDITSRLISDALFIYSKIILSIPCSENCHKSNSLSLQGNIKSKNELGLCWVPEHIGSSCNSIHQYSSSLSSRLSNSHNSLLTSRIDETSFISSSVSHDVLSSSQSSEIYHVPLDSDNYAIPVGVVGSNDPRPPVKTKKHSFRDRCHSADMTADPLKVPIKSKKRNISSLRSMQPTHGMAESMYRSSLLHGSRPTCSESEPIHLTLQEVRQYMHNYYASSSDSSENRNVQESLRNFKNPFRSIHNNRKINTANNNNLNKDQYTSNYNNNIFINNNNNYHNKSRKSAFSMIVKGKKAKENYESSNGSLNKIENLKKCSTCRPSFTTSVKQALCNIFRFKRFSGPEQCMGKRDSIPHSDDIGARLSRYDRNPPSPITKPPFSNRALPPLPIFEEIHGDIIVTDSTPLPSPDMDAGPPPLPLRVKRCNEDQCAIDFASSIDKVKDYGWYWGPISGEAAERILSNEPDGSFIVRDSSDDYYIFSLTFKLNSIIRHVRIEHDQGKFSFGSSHRFKSNTIVDFIESAVEHSRSGRYLFFLHRRPILGPMRVQLLHPVSRFKQVQSLQHMCRFVILRFVRKDLIRDLPLPEKVLDYLSKQHYYSEQFFDDEDTSSSFQELNQILCFANRGFS